MTTNPARPQPPQSARIGARLAPRAAICGAIAVAAVLVGCDTPPAASPPSADPRPNPATSAGSPPLAHFEPWAGEVIVGPGTNLAGRNLRGTRLVGADLAGANFDGSDLYAARLSRCDLRKASFRGTLLTGAMLEACDVTGADFTDAVIEDMVHGEQPMRLSPEQLRSTRSYVTKRLHHCLIRGNASVAYDFSRAELDGAEFDGELDAADFRGADIRNCTFRGPIRCERLAAAKAFRERKLERVRLLGGVTGKQDFSAFRFQDCELLVGNDAAFEGAEFVGCCRIDGDFDRLHLASTVNFRRGNLSNLHFARIDLSGFNLSGTNLTGAVFDAACNLKNADFNDAVITRCVFRDDRATLGLTAEQIRSTWNYRQGRMAGVVVPPGPAETLAREPRSNQDAAGAMP